MYTLKNHTFFNRGQLHVSQSKDILIGIYKLLWLCAFSANMTKIESSYMKTLFIRNKWTDVTLVLDGVHWVLLAFYLFRTDRLLFLLFQKNSAYTDVTGVLSVHCPFTIWNQNAP